MMTEENFGLREKKFNVIQYEQAIRCLLYLGI